MVLLLIIEWSSSRSLATYILMQLREVHTLWELPCSSLPLPRAWWTLYSRDELVNLQGRVDYFAQGQVGLGTRCPTPDQCSPQRWLEGDRRQAADPLCASGSAASDLRSSEWLGTGCHIIISWSIMLCTFLLLLICQQKIEKKKAKLSVTLTAFTNKELQN